MYDLGEMLFPLSLSSLLCKTVTTCTHFLGELQGLQKIIQIITCTSHLAHSRCSINLSFLNRAGEEVEITANIKKKDFSIIYICLPYNLRYKKKKSVQVNTLRSSEERSCRQLHSLRKELNKKLHLTAYNYAV